ncbi:MotA/TolQ/ExbB proton channel family protein [Sphingobacteriales bacterium UPWRP_1]|nr:biopolymer transporter ExbB [Sphingobacteriales bacterium TSM_CSS]PSJ72335.1 MotA/TolQ/ExbB proton channel family protein [Sphingobacteriales bacterium UPWRP_1]
MYLFLLLQAADSTATAAGQNASLSFWKLYMLGGLGYMIPLTILSVVAVYVFIERYIKITTAARIDKNFMDQIQNYMLKGDTQSATALCQQQDTPIARMVEKGIKRLGKPLRSIEVAIENEGKLELMKLEKNLAILASIAGVAPMIGFLGTVTGMITAFFQISNAGSTVDPSMLAGGIYQALITTAAGLMIGIPAYMGYNFLVTLVENVVFKMEATSIGFVDFLQEPAK